MIWLDTLDDRGQKEVEFARVYQQHYAHGTDGHGRLLLIAKLAALLDTMETDLRQVQGQCTIFEDLVLAAAEQLGDVTTPLPVSIARLKGELLAARRVVDAARNVPDAATRSSALREALLGYDEARKDTTP